jgi:hypothetical protein
MTVLAACPQEIAMAKAQKGVAVRKKTSKRRKTSARPAHKMAAKHAIVKKAKSKDQRAGMGAKKSAIKKRRHPETVERASVSEMSVDATIIDAIEEPAPGVVAVTEYESVWTTTAISAGDEPESGEGVGPAGTSTMAPHEAEEQRDALKE